MACPSAAASACQRQGNPEEARCHTAEAARYRTEEAARCRTEEGGLFAHQELHTEGGMMPKVRADLGKGAVRSGAQMNTRR